MDSFIKTPIKANQNQLIMGHLLEPIAAYWYQQKTGNTVYNGVFPPFRHFEKFANDGNGGPRQRGKKRQLWVT